MNKKFAASTILLYIAAVFILLCVSAVTGHCAIGKGNPNSNAFGAIIYQDNPNEYLEGAIVNGIIHQRDGRTFTTLRVQPTNTYLSFTQEVTFCGDVSGQLQEAKGLVVMTYGRVMRETYCYDLRSIHKVVETKSTEKK